MKHPVVDRIEPGGSWRYNTEEGSHQFPYTMMFCKRIVVFKQKEDYSSGNEQYKRGSGHYSGIDINYPCLMNMFPAFIKPENPVDDQVPQIF